MDKAVDPRFPPRYIHEANLPHVLVVERSALCKIKTAQLLCSVPSFEYDIHVLQF